MSNHELTTQVRASEVITFVVVAFAVEQIAQGTIQRLWTAWHLLDPLDILSVVALCIVLVFTAVRFYHGNAVYLSRRYAAWHHRQLSQGGVIAIPLAHTFDTFAHLFEYLCLVAAGYFLGVDDSIAHVGYALVALFAIDGLWTLFAIPTSRSGGRGIGSASSGPLVTWCITNLVTASLIGGVLFASDKAPLTTPGAQWIPLFVLGVMVLNTAVDYKLNYDHYFEQPLTPEWVSARQANQSMQQLLQCIELSATLESPPEEADQTKWLKEKLQLLFAFMLQDSARKEVFQRTRGNLHVGIYFERNGALYPAFRWAPKFFKLNNRSFPLGRNFVGTAYTALLEKPESAQIFDTYKDSRVDTSDALPTDREYYKSSVMANIYWPPGGKTSQPVGILVITSDEESYFTRTVHEPLVIGFCREISNILRQLYAKSTTRDQLVTALHAKFDSNPIVVNDSAPRSS